MVIFLYGADRYRLFQNRDSVIASFKVKHGGALNVQTINAGEPGSPADFKASISNNSFFNDIQLVVLQDVFANPTNVSKFAELIDQYDVFKDKQRILVAVHPGVDSTAKPAEFFKLLVSGSHLVREFKPLAGGQLEQWLKKEAVSREPPFPVGAVRQFIALSGDDSWQAIANMDKLSAYCQGPITLAAVNELVSQEAQPEVFAFIDALGTQNRSRALELLYRELSLRQDPYYLLTMIIYQFRTMLMVQDSATRSANAVAIATETGLKPFVVKKMMSIVSRFSAADLRRIYQSLCDIELGSKDGRHDIQDALYAFVAKY